MTALAFVAGCLIGGTLGALAMALACAASTPVSFAPDGEGSASSPTAAPGLAAELAELRRHLSVCQATAETQRQRADTYYDLYCEGAKANADLRRNGQ